MQPIDIPPHEIPWKPLSPNAVARLFDDWDRFWCIAGGWALDLTVGKHSREHDDTDVLVLRRDVEALHPLLSDWELWAADPPGQLRPWFPAEQLPQRVHDIWCRPEGERNWRFQIMVMEHDDNRWIFRRNPAIGGPLASLSSVVDGRPVIAPQVQLLFKGTSTIVRPKDEADFRMFLPHLASAQRVWLSTALGVQVPGHPWLQALDES